MILPEDFWPNFWLAVSHVVLVAGLFLDVGLAVIIVMMLLNSVSAWLNGHGHALNDARRRAFKILETEA